MRDRWIHKTWEYQIIYRKGIKVVGKGFVVYSVSEKQDKPRFGITVTRKVGKAVVRNRVKRVIREIIRRNICDWDGAVDTVIVARKKILTMSFKEIEKELLEILNKISKRLSLPPIST